MARTASEVGRSNVNRSKAHERQVANCLAAWSGVIFRRRRAEGRGAAVVEVEGAADVIAVGSDFHFSVEAKCGKGFSLDAMMAHIDKALFTSWWHQATYDADIMTASRERRIFPMLFFRPFVNANWVAIPVSATPLLRPSSGGAVSPLWFPHLVFGGYSGAGPIAGDVSHSPKHKKIVEVQLDDVVMCRWADFAANVEPRSAFFTYSPAQE